MKVQTPLVCPHCGKNVVAETQTYSPVQLKKLENVKNLPREDDEFISH